MRFSFGLVALIAASANAVIPVVDLKSGLDQITTLANGLTTEANSISTTKSIPILSGLSTATDIANGVQQVITIATNLTSTANSSGGGVYTDADTDQILASLQKLSAAITDLVSTLTNKSSFFKSNPVAGTIVATALGLLSPDITSLFNTITPTLSSTTSTTSATSLLTTIQTLIAKFLKLSLPTTN